MKKVLISLILILLPFSLQTYAYSTKTNLIKKTLVTQYNRFSKTNNGKMKITQSIDINIKKFSKNPEVLTILEELKNQYKVNTECPIGSTLQDGQCIQMPVKEYISQETQSSINNDGNTATSLRQQIDTLENQTNTARISLERGRDSIEEKQDAIKVIKATITAEQKQIDVIKAQYASAENEMKTQNEIALERSNIAFAKLGLSFSNAASDTSKQIYNQGASNLTNLDKDMNDKITSVQLDIDKKNADIERLNKEIDKIKQDNEYLKNQIQDSEENLIKMRSHL